ncbi:MAG: hypothetical protein ACOCUR_02550, partial [Nanoarchaeota archaeon]
EIEKDNYVISEFGGTIIETSGNPNYLSLTHYFQEDNTMFEKPLLVETIVRNNGPGKQDMKVIKSVPREFDVVPLNDDITISKDENGNTNIKWNGRIGSEKSKKIEYNIVYKEKYRIYFEGTSSNVKIFNQSFVSEDFIKIYSKQKLLEKLAVTKHLSYNTAGDNVSVTMEFTNSGDTTLKEIVAMEYIPEESVKTFWMKNQGEIEIPSLNPGDTFTFYYETENHENITLIPVVLGVEPDDVMSKLVLDSHFKILQNIIIFLRFQTIAVLIVITLMIVYLHNLNIQKNKNKKRLFSAMHEALKETISSVKSIPKNVLMFFGNIHKRIKDKIKKIKELLKKQS